MVMDDHDHHQHHHHHGYGLTDLRQLVSGPHFPNSIQPQPTAPGHRNFPPPPLSSAAAGGNQHQHLEMMMFGCDMMMMPRGLHDFASTGNIGTVAGATTSAVSTPTPVSGSGFLEGEGGGGGDTSTGRWPRQETLTLLEIRSGMDPKFKEANQKGPLWEEVSRIMCEEHGYQRSGKKCREKFENLYKYYKKTKEGKAGRQDGKHYRFFRQLEALYGENNNNNNNNMSSSSAPTIETNNNIFGGTNLLYVPNYQPSPHHHHNKHNCDSISLTTNSTTRFDTSSSLPSSEDSDDNDDDDDESTEKKRKRNNRSWKAKIKEFIDSQMRKLVEKQEEWLEKLVKTMEQKEKERVLREEEWRREEATRLEREHKFWAKERAWIEARDVALMDALQKLTRREIIKAENIPRDHEEGVINIMRGEIQNQDQNQNNEDGSEILNSNVVVRGVDCWPESEFTRLQQLRAEVETRFPQREVLFAHPKADIL